MRGLRHRARGSVALVLCAGSLAGCGSSGEARLSASDAARLRSVLAATRTAAGRGDAAGALEQLRTFDSDVRALAAKGRLTPADARALRVGARQARAAVARGVQPTPTPTPTAAPPPAPTPAKPPKQPPGHSKKPPKGKHGKGHG